MKATRSKRQCDICGNIHYCDNHHPAREANDPEFILSVGVKEHSKYLTQSQYIAGLSPGIGKAPAVVMGTLQSLTLMMQQQGQLYSARLFESLADDAAGQYGKRTEKRTARKNERRIGTLVNDPDSVYLTHRMGKVISRAGYRLMSDPACPVELYPVLVLTATFYEAISEHPKAYLQYMQENASPETFGNYAGTAGFRQTDSWQALDDFADLFAPHAIGFLRKVRRQPSEPVAAIA